MIISNNYRKGKLIKMVICFIDYDSFTIEKVLHIKNCETLVVWCFTILSVEHFIQKVLHTKNREARNTCFTILSVEHFMEKSASH